MEGMARQERARKWANEAQAEIPWTLWRCRLPVLALQAPPTAQPRTITHAGMVPRRELVAIDGRREGTGGVVGAPTCRGWTECRVASVARHGPDAYGQGIMSSARATHLGKA